MAYPNETEKDAAANLNIEDLIIGTISDDETKLTGRLLSTVGTEDESNNDLSKKRQERQNHIINALKTLRLSHLNYNPNRSRTMTATEILNIRQNNNTLSKLWHFCERFADTCVDYCIAINTYCLIKLRIDSAVVYLSTSVMHVFHAIEKTILDFIRRLDKTTTEFDFGRVIQYTIRDKTEEIEHVRSAIHPPAKLF